MNVVAYLLGHAWTNRKWEWSGLGRQQLGDGICWHSLRLTAILGKQLAIPDDNPLQNHKQTRSTNPSSRNVHATLPTNSWHLTPRGSWTLKGPAGPLAVGFASHAPGASPECYADTPKPSCHDLGNIQHSSNTHIHYHLRSWPIDIVIPALNILFIGKLDTSDPSRGDWGLQLLQHSLNVPLQSIATSTCNIVQVHIYTVTKYWEALATWDRDFDN